MSQTLLRPEILWTIGVLGALVGVAVLLWKSVGTISFLKHYHLNGSRKILAVGKLRRALIYATLLSACGWIGVDAVVGHKPGIEVIWVLVAIPFAVAFDAWSEIYDDVRLDREANRRDRRSGDPPRRRSTDRVPGGT